MELVQCALHCTPWVESIGVFILHCISFILLSLHYRWISKIRFCKFDRWHHISGCTIRCECLHSATSHMAPTEMASTRPDLTHWGRGKVVTISQTTFSNGFFWMKLYWFRYEFTPNSQINIPALVQIMASHRPGPKPFSEPMIIIPTHIRVTRPQWGKHVISDESL